MGVWGEVECGEGVRLRLKGKKVDGGRGRCERDGRGDGEERESGKN